MLEPCVEVDDDEEDEKDDRQDVASFKQKSAEILRLCELNKAACALKLGDPLTAKQSCTVVLKDEPQNTKALFRRATALTELGEPEEPSRIWTGCLKMSRTMLKPSA